MGKVNRKYITIIDGYNVINAWPELKKDLDENLENARDMLIDKMVNFKHLSNERIIIVFDAQFVEKNRGSKETIKGIEIVYTKEDMNADSYIEEKVALLTKDLRNVVKVVTFDYAEQQNILGNGATRVTPLEFKHRIIDMEKRYKLIYIDEEKRKNKKNDLSDNLDVDVLKKLTELIDK